MYSPSFYREERQDLIFELIRENGFGTLLTHSGEGLNISHLPFLLEQEPSPQLLCHMAKANGQWRDFASGRAAKIIFQGPHGYVSPAWYQPRPSNVPTWNYAVVHVSGTPVLVSDPVQAYEVLCKLVKQSEDQYGTGWALPEPRGQEIDKLLGAIVVFEVQDLAFEAKFKLSQKVDPMDREKVVKGLSGLGTEAARKLAQWMAKTKP